VTPGAPRRLLLIADEAESEFIRDLRSLGHGVIVAGDIGEARRLMDSEGADLALVPAGVIAGLADLESWRRSARSVGAEVRQVTGILESRLQDFGEGEGAPGGTVTRAEVAVVIGLLRELLDDLGTGSGEAVSRTVFRLEDMVEAAALAVYPAASDRNQRLAVMIDEDVTMLSADENKLRRALSKLLDHASRRAGRAGSISVHAAREGADCVLTLAYQAQEGTPLSSAAEGLGLVSRLVAVQGGLLDVSAEGAGESVRIVLPGAAEELAVGQTAREDGKF
jgi:signal transduction histidine kinase